MDKHILLALKILVVVSMVRSESLTFYGGDNPADSMVIYDAWKAKVRGILNFQFKTSKPDGLLLYMYGKTKRSSSYIKLSLEIGRLSLTISHSQEENIEEQLGRDLHDSNWHNVTIIRNHRTTLFELDGTQRIITKLHWKAVLEVTSDLYVGNTLARIGSTGFIGCIKDLKYGEGYNEMKQHPVKEKGINTSDECFNFCDKDSTKPRCSTGTCLNKFTHFECDCFGTGFEGKYCQKRSPIISLQSNMDFISKTSISMQSIRSNKIQVRFKTINKDGILLTLGKSNDFFTLELHDGFVRVETNVGGGKVTLHNNRQLHDGLWHDIKVKQNGPDFTLIVDNKSINRFEQTRSSPYRHLETSCLGKDIAYFGGNYNPITAIGSKSKQGFVGCLQQFYFNEINLIQDVLITLEIMKRSNRTHTDTQIDGVVDTKCNVLPREIKDTVKPPKTKETTRKPNIRVIVRPTIINTSGDGTNPEASTALQTPQVGKRNPSKLQKSSVAWITAGLVIGALVIIIVMAFLVHRFRKKYRGTFMAPRDENGMPYYSSVQATYHMQNGVGKRQGRGNATDV